ncbi:radical SAM protein [Segatella copri]|jgi:uncharacterized protein|uniref:radical SAM protein n=1 Tax=Segatella copri TaxID=165179 RepID=UPI00294B25CF|nr:radical SAM protein [Segatella copri]
MNVALEYSRKIYVSTNFSCNLNCVYCYEKVKNSIEFDVSEAFSVLKNILKEKTEFGTKIKLHGGEPFLVFPKIKQLCENLWKENLPEFYRFHLTTNGTLIHGEIQDWLYENRDKIVLKLSLDGNRTSHNLNRSNSFELIDTSFFVKTWSNVRVNMVITPATLPYVSENIKFLHSIGFKQIISRFSLMTDWQPCKLKKEFYLQMLDLAVFYLTNPTVEPCEFFSYNISWTMVDEDDVYPCNAGKVQAYDFQTRKFYPCHMCFPSVCGKEKSLELEHMELNNSKEQQEESCMSCPFINICKTCYADNYIMRGSIYRRDMSLCDYQKIVFVVLFKYEYARIMKVKNPTAEDVWKMKAIQKWYSKIKAIENDLLHQLK